MIKKLNDATSSDKEHFMICSRRYDTIWKTDDNLFFEHEIFETWTWKSQKWTFLSVSEWTMELKIAIKNFLMNRMRFF